MAEGTRGGPVRRRLIYDLGMHKGEDTDFYLKKGFSVIAVEASKALCEQNAVRFAREIEEGRLTIVNKAISTSPGSVDFFFNDHVSEWSTTRVDWAHRNALRGAPSHIGRVETVTLIELLNKFGEPYYLKIDIEGADVECLADLAESTIRPPFVSVEASSTSLRETLTQLKLLARMDYRRFAIIPQQQVRQQTPPLPAREGIYLDYQFERGATGLFGKETPGRWLSLRQAEWLYRMIHTEMRLIGPNNGILRGIQSRRLETALRKAFRWGVGWYDTHASR